MQTPGHGARSVPEAKRFTMVTGGFEPRVLVVEDDSYVLEETTLALRSGGFKCEAAHSGREALRFLQDYPDTSVVIVDLRMPEMDGFTLMTAIEDHFALIIRPDVIVLSGHLDPESTASAIKRGAVDCLAKPVSRSALVQSVQSAADRVIEKRSALEESSTLSGLVGGATPLLAQATGGLRSTADFSESSPVSSSTARREQASLNRAAAQGMKLSRLLSERETRYDIFPSTFSSEHAWAMLLEMAHNHYAGRITYLSALAVGVRLPVSTSSRHLDALGKEGLVERFPDPADKRRVRATLTPEGLRKIEEYLDSLE